MLELWIAGFEWKGQWSFLVRSTEEDARYEVQKYVHQWWAEEMAGTLADEELPPPATVEKVTEDHIAAYFEAVEEEHYVVEKGKLL